MFSFVCPSALRCLSLSIVSFLRVVVPFLALSESSRFTASSLADLEPDWSPSAAEGSVGRSRRVPSPRNQREPASSAQTPFPRKETLTESSAALREALKEVVSAARLKLPFALSWTPDFDLPFRPIPHPCPTTRRTTRTSLWTTPTTCSETTLTRLRTPSQRPMRETRRRGPSSPVCSFQRLLQHQAGS